MTGLPSATTNHGVPNSVLRSSTSPLARLTLVLPLLTAGCFLDSDEDRSHEELRACWNGATEEEAVDNVQVSLDYARSLHEMVACGGLAVDVCIALTSGVVEAIQEGADSAMPGGWTFDNGVYRTESLDGGQATRMAIQFFASKDYAFAEAGEPIAEDVFLIDNYLVGAVVSIDFTSGAAELSYDSVGPLVELLGYGLLPDNPIRLSLNDSVTIGNSIGQLEFTTEVVVSDMQNNSAIDYTTQTRRLSANDLIGGTPLVFDVVLAEGSRADLEQELSVESWTIDYKSDGGLLGLGGGTLDGSSEYRVTGGHFDYSGIVRFPDSKEGETELSCE